jgi:hypothetical protein
VTNIYFQQCRICDYHKNDFCILGHQPSEKELNVLFLKYSKNIFKWNKTFFRDYMNAIVAAAFASDP